MKNSKVPNKKEQELLDAIIEMLVDTEPETAAELDAELRNMGFDPEALTSKIEAVVEEVWATSPHNWRFQERKKIEGERKRYEQSKLSQDSSVVNKRQRLQGLLSQHRPQFAAAHRNLNLDEVSDEDVASLLHQYEYLTNDALEEE